ncbi:hypothetical protein PLICRDRAFT_29566 [Plicaturopsis crispa FD-325 SS-3]|nr:hypothetical protein PLICRDRAFT_29566 [Plicaturopsis crispa FD-325 SS-3]
MSPEDTEALEERVAQLEAIKERRNELLREMYHMVRRRDNVGTVFVLDEDEEEDLDAFLERFDLEKNPETGYIDNLLDSDALRPVSADVDERASRSGPENDSSPEVKDEQPEEQTQAANAATSDMDMDVDDDSPFPSPSRPRRTRFKQLEDSEDSSSSVPLEERVSRKPSSPPPETPQDGDHDTLDDINKPPLGPAPNSRDNASFTPASPSPIEPREGPRSTEPMSSQPPDQQNMSTPEPEERRVHPPIGHIAMPTLPSELIRDLKPPVNAEVQYPAFAASPKAPLSHTPSAFDMSHRSSSGSIPAPASLVGDNLPYNFPEAVEADTKPSRTPASPISQHFNPAYTIPPLKDLPAEYQRKGKPTKQQRKREKEREKNGSDKESRKDDFIPWGVNKWGAVLRANPVWKKLTRSTKCLNTREWGVAVSEVRLLRTLERIETLKDAGRWSFRQPKKQRGVGGLTKTHWDYLMDEMRWMRIDFREERKWKLAMAYNLGTAVLQWHAAGSPEERLSRGICVLWKPPPPVDETAMDEQDTLPMDMDDGASESGQENPLSMVDYASDDDDQEADQQDVLDVLETGNATQDALDAADPSSQPASQEEDASQDQVEPKVEELDDSSALHREGNNADDSAMDVDPSQQSQEAKLTQETEPDNSQAALKPTSTNPILASGSGSTSHSHSVAGEASTSTSKRPLPSSLYEPFREQIAYSEDDKLFIDEDDFDLVKGVSGLTTSDDAINVHPAPSDLSEIFPDLQPLELLNVAPPLTGSSKKSERRSDRDDPNKRAEDTTYTKLTPIGKFMHCKPTLLGPLEPAKHWKNGRWSHIEEAPIMVDLDTPPSKPFDESMSGTKPLQDLFESNKPPNGPPANMPILPIQPKDKKRGHEWSQQDDLTLKQVAERYPNNWPLVADAFNASRHTLSIDKRTPWDCFERWNQRWSAGARHAMLNSPASVDETPNSTAPSTPAQMTTRGVKRLTSVGVANINTAVNNGASDPKKRRHALMATAIQKAAKKRESALKASNANQRKMSAVHDTHNAYANLPKLTPVELSRMKAEKDAKDAQEMMARRRQDEINRQQLISQRMQVPSQQQPGHPLQQQHPNGIPRPGSNGLPQAQGVPQIRSQVNISQQQRMPVPMATPGTRMSPQQMMQAQQVAAARAMALSGSGNGNGLANSLLASPYGSRADTSSPALQGSPPHNSAPVANSPRPPSAQAQAQQQQQQQQQQALPQAPQQVPGNALPRPPGNMGHYFPAVVPNLQGAQFTQEQMEQALRLQGLIQAQHRMSQPPQNGQYPPPS